MNRIQFQKKLEEAGITSPVTKVVTRAKKRGYFTKRTTSFLDNEVDEIIYWEKKRIVESLEKGFDPTTGHFTKDCHINKGKFRTEENKTKISSTLTGNQNAKGAHNISAEQRQRWSELRKGIEPVNKGEKMSDDFRKKVSEGVKKAFDNPQSIENMKAAWTNERRDAASLVMKQNLMEKWGGSDVSCAIENMWQIPEIREKLIESMKASWTPERRKANGIQAIKNLKNRPKYFCHCFHFDSSWECIYYLSFCDKTKTGRPIYPENVVRNSSLSFEYEYDGQKHNYYPDFIVDGKPVEVKGEHLLGQNPFDHNLDGLFKAKYQCMLDNNVEIITDIEPFRKVVESKFCPEFWELFRTDIPFPGNSSHPANDDIWKCRTKGHLSPLEAWDDSKIRTLAAFNRLVYGNVGEYHKYATPQPSDILKAFSIAKYAPKVSEFSVRLAKRLLQEYAIGNTVVDPFAGFGARKNAAEELGFEYHGFDIEAKNGLDITIRDVLSDFPVEEYDTLLTCSPYNDKEEWLNECCNKTCDEWIDVCLSKFKCKRYIFVVDKTDKYNDKVVGHCNNNGLIGKTGKELVVVL